MFGSPWARRGGHVAREPVVHVREQLRQGDIGRHGEQRQHEAVLLGHVFLEEHLQGPRVGRRPRRAGCCAQGVDERGEAAVFADQALDEQTGLEHAVGDGVERGFLGRGVRQQRAVAEGDEICVDLLGGVGSRSTAVSSIFTRPASSPASWAWCASAPSRAVASSGSEARVSTLMVGVSSRSGRRGRPMRAGMALRAPTPGGMPRPAAVSGRTLDRTGRHAPYALCPRQPVTGDWPPGRHGMRSYRWASAVRSVPSMHARRRRHPSPTGPQHGDHWSLSRPARWGRKVVRQGPPAPGAPRPAASSVPGHGERSRTHGAQASRAGGGWPLAARRLLTRREVSADGRAVFGEGDPKWEELLPGPLGARQGGALHARRELHRLLLVDGVRQGRHHHLGAPGHRLPVDRRGLPRVRAARLPARGVVLLVHLLAQPGPLPVCARRAAEAVARGAPAARRPGGGLGGDHRRPGEGAGATSGPAARAAWCAPSWDEVAELVAAAHVHTVKAYGPDRRRRLLADPGDVDGVATRPAPASCR